MGISFSRYLCSHSLTLGQFPRRWSQSSLPQHLRFCLIEIILPVFKASISWFIFINSCDKLASVSRLLCTISLLIVWRSFQLTCSAASNFKACSKADFKFKTSSIHTTVCISGSLIPSTKYWRENISRIFARQSKNAKFLRCFISEAIFFLFHLIFAGEFSSGSLYSL